MLDKLVVSTDSYLIYVVKLTDDYSTSTYIYDSVHRTRASRAMSSAIRRRTWTPPIATRWPG